MDSLEPFTRRVTDTALRAGRTHLGGIRFNVRGPGGSLAAELMSFAGGAPQEERVLVVKSPGGAVVLLEAFPDLAARLGALGEEPFAR